MRSTLLIFSLLTGLLFGWGSPPHRMNEESEVKEKLKLLALEQVNAKCAECKINVECKWIAPTLANASPASITALKFDKAGLPAGYVTAKAVLKGEGFSTKTTVQFFISVQQKLPIASSSINRGDVILEANLAWQWKDISRMNRQPISSVDFFKGKTTARMIRKGQVFYPSDLLAVASIKPGDQVSMEYGEAGVRIQINCIAREAKGVGEKIRLYSKETGQRYIAKIISKNKVIWERTL